MRSRRYYQELGVFVENEEGMEIDSSSCSTVPSGKRLYSMEVFSSKSWRSANFHATRN